jgi:hypothetical protein
VVVRPEDGISRSVCQTFASTLPLRIVHVGEPGVVAALNAGRDAARGSILALTDDDAEPTVEWIQAIASQFRDPRVGAVGGRDILHDDDGDLAGRNPVSRVGIVQWFGRPIGRHHHPSPRQDVDFLKGVNMSFRAPTLQPFDAKLWGEGAQVCYELEACLSVRSRGWRVVFDPGVAVHHHPAPRHDGAREAPSMEATQAFAHNELYALLRHGRTWQLLTVTGYALAVGHSSAPGLLRAAARVTRRREDARATVSLSMALTRARLRAIRTAVQARRGSPEVQATVSP